MQEWEKAGLAAKDKIHFTKTGYQLLGDMFFEAMMKLKGNGERINESVMY
jgi:lysophospholipase L1-like esterase